MCAFFRIFVKISFMQAILHLIGFCPDHFNHINIIDAPWQEFLNLFNNFKSIFRK